MNILNIGRTFAAMLIASFMFSSTAFAQSTVLVVDQAKVLRDSDVGKHVNRQLQSIAKQMGTEMQSQFSPLTSERDRLVSELKNMSAAALKSRPDLQKRAVTLKQKVEKSQLDEAYKKKELQVTEQKALLKINKKLETILQAIVKERNADVLLDRSMVIYTGKSIDITSTVISRLNSQMRTVSVIRERLPRKALPTKAK